jgi:hypothetical protein
MLLMLWFGTTARAFIQLAFTRFQVSLEKIMCFVAEADTCLDFTIMAIVLEPSRHLTGVFLSCGARASKIHACIHALEFI